MSILSLTQAMAETIKLDDVVDDTPGQSFSAAGAAIQISINAGGTHDYHRFVGPPTYSNAQTNFSDDVKIVLRTPDDSNRQYNWTIEPSALSVSIRVLGLNRKVLVHSDLVYLKIERDPHNPLDARYRIRITSFTPGPVGTTGQGTATAVIEKI